MFQATQLHRLLGDDARLRLLRVVAQGRLNVSELTAVLGLAQSGVSRHLGLLRESGLLVEERSGGFTYYRLAAEATPDAPDPLWRLLAVQFLQMGSEPAARADQARLHEVLRLRKEQFEQHRADDREAGQLVPGRSWAAWARALGHLLPPMVVADLGCGEGYLTLEAARFARRVIGVDRSAVVLRRARALAERRRVSNVVWKRGTIERVPLDDASVDLALLSQALHHAAEPSHAIAEAARIVVPGGRVLVLELKAHDQSWVRDRLGDRWLGFDERDLARLLNGAGLASVVTSTGARGAVGGFTVIVASGVRPASPTSESGRGRSPSQRNPTSGGRRRHA